MKPISALFAGSVAVAMRTARPAPCAPPHPAFEDAEQSLQVATHHVRNAQQNSGPTFGGHAGRAIELMRQA